VSRWLDPILRSIADEATETFPGRAVVLNRLADVLFVRVVRAHLLKMSAAAENGPPSWLRGLTDPRIARALAQIRRAPEQAWTLAQLASRAAMSRTAFAQRFRSLVGQAPVTYLASWRM
jgi:transcriptional regulator GlxA family with amidase domain